jgi:hypothetical protein
VCPDADVLASFSAGELGRDERVGIERHLSSCDRCAQILALAVEAEPARSGDVRGGASAAWWRWRWLVPAATAVTVAGIWFASSSPEIRRTTAPFAVVNESVEADPAADAAKAAPSDTRLADARARSEPAPLASTPAPPPPMAPAAAARQAVRQERLAESGPERREESSAERAVVDAPAAAAAPRAPAEQEQFRAAARADGAAASAAAAESAATDRSSPETRFAAEILARSPDGRALWRRAGNAIERSAGGGAWVREYAAGSPIIAGSAVSADVAWFAAAGGVVLRRTAAGWSMPPLPVSGIEIAAIDATSAASAIVTLADGRQLETQNGGTSWQTRSPKQ